MAGRGKRAIPAAFRLPKDIVDRLDSIASAPGSTRIAQGLAPPKNWLKISGQGSLGYIKGDRHLMSKDLAIPYRDLRLLDPEVPMAYPSAILVREKALLIHLESIRMVIAKDAVYVLTIPSSEDRHSGVLPTADASFIKDLILRISDTADTSKQTFGRSERNSRVDVDLPFELKALEGALHAAVAAVEADTLDLEQSIGASLDRLDLRVSRRELEHIQQGKVSLSHLLTKVSRITQLLEDILDDDADMADMYLGRRAQLSATAPLQADVAVDADSDAGPDPAVMFRDDLLNQEAAPEQSGGSMAEMLCKSRRRRSSTTGASGRGSLEKVSVTSETGMGAFWAEAPTLQWTKARNLSLVCSPNIAACEGLLETYFMQADYALSRLLSLKERTEATESLATLHLAQRRNELVSFDLMLTVVSINVAFFGGVASLCGMNLWLGGSGAPKEAFVICVVLALTLSTGIMSAIFAYAKYHQLLLIPSQLV